MTARDEGFGERGRSWCVSQSDPGTQWIRTPPFKASEHALEGIDGPCAEGRTRVLSFAFQMTALNFSFEQEFCAVMLSLCSCHPLSALSLKGNQEMMHVAAIDMIETSYDVFVTSGEVQIAGTEALVTSSCQPQR